MADPTTPSRIWMGRERESLGHWEGDTLVIDTIGFNDTSWLDIGASSIARTCV